MVDVESVIEGNIPTVSPLDIQRLWSLQSQHSTGSLGYSIEVILQVCESASADPIAVWARTALIGILLQQGVLESWRENDCLSQVVFDAAGTFPLPTGLQGLNPSEFIAWLPI
ncbi:MAG: hypothetical protein JWO80_5155 [Bryobacterales bacterium]|nr:hypothetical protein [Bryobacterales bacterium]